MEQPKVLIVILNWNGLEDTLDCLSSVNNLEYDNYRVIVIDNNSVNDELSVIRTRFPNVIGIQSSTNLGFTGGCNLGIRRAIQENAEYIWLLNNDSIVLTDTLLKLIYKMEHDGSIGMISPVIYYRNHDRIECCGTRMCVDTLKGSTLREINDYLDVERKAPLEVFLWGTAILLRTKMVEQIGFFDDRYFAYFEDADLSFRAIKGGWKNSVDVCSGVLHGTTKKKPKQHMHYYVTRNEYIFINTHSLPKFRNRNILKYLSKAITYSAVLKERGQIEDSKIVLDGIWHAHKKIYGEWRNNERTPSFITQLVLWHPYFLAKILYLL